MNSYAGRAMAIVIAILMVIVMSTTTTVVVDAKDTISALTISTSEDVIEIEEKGCYAEYIVTEQGVVNNAELAC